MVFNDSNFLEALTPNLLIHSRQWSSWLKTTVLFWGNESINELRFSLKETSVVLGNKSIRSIGLMESWVFTSKTSQAFNFIIKKLNTIGVLVSERKNIYDPPSYRKFSRLSDKVDPVKAIFKKRVSLTKSKPKTSPILIVIVFLFKV